MSHRDALSYDEHDHYHDDPDHSDSNSTATDELEEEEEDECCPLCMEPFDATDREFTPCKCGYKICLWCLTGDHMVLTRSGWQSIKLVALGEVVASYNVGTKAMEWKEVEKKQCYAAAASEQHQLFRMEGAGMDVVATRNHRMLVAQLYNGHLQKRQPFSYPTVEKLLELTYSKGTEPAEGERNTTSQFDRTMVRAVLRSGVNNEEGFQFSIRGLEAVCAWWWQKDEQMGFLRFLGFWLGDGHLVLGRYTSYVCITQQKPEPTEWLIELLDEVFPRWWYRVKGREDANGTTWTYYIRCPPLVDWLAVMAAGPQGYSPVDPVAVRSYPHFTYDGGLAAVESQSLYRQPCSVGRWSEPVMLAAMATVDCCWWCGKSECAEGEQWLLCDRLDRTRCNRGAHLSCAGLTETPEGEWLCPDCDGTSQEYMRETDSQPTEEERMEEEAEEEEAESEEEEEAGGEVEVSGLLDDAAAKAARVAGKLLWWNNTAPVAPIVVAPVLLPPPLPAVQPPPPVPNPGNVPIPAGAAIVPWNNGWWIIINGHWFYLKRWLGANVASTFSHMSQKQAVALLEGFHRADGCYASIQFDERGEPIGCWFCSNSSFPLISHLMLIGQLAGASVDLTLRVEAGTKSFIQGREVRCTVDHWMLSIHFSPPARTAPVHSVYLAKPEPADDIPKRGYWQYQDDGNVYCITVKDNGNFLTQRLSMKRLQSEKGGLGVRAQPVFVGNCWHNLNNIYTNTSSSASTSSLLSSSAADRPPLAGRCPACRQPYQYPEMTFNAAALQSSLTAKQQKKAHRDKHKRDKSTTHNTSSASATSTATATAAASAMSDTHSKSTSDNSTRVLQRNLMYVANLPASIAKEELLEDKRYFGKFGKIVKIAITRKAGSGSGSSAGGSYSAYVTFKRAADCAVALQLCHHTVLAGQIVKCMYGTTKYCPFWLRSVPCTMNRCGYLHALASPEDVVGKEELQAMERKRDNEKSIPFPLQTSVTEALAAAKAHKSVQPADETDLPSSSSTYAFSSSPVTAAPSASTANLPASVWKLPVAPSITASSSATSASFPSTSTASPSVSSSSTAAAATSASAASNMSSTSGSLRPYVSILAQSHNATHSPPSASTSSVPSSAVTNEIIRIVPSYLKDKFTASATPSSAAQQHSTTAASTSSTTSSGRSRKGGSTSSTANGSPALSPVSTASSSSITASPSMSRSTSKASRASSPIPSPLLQPASSASSRASSPISSPLLQPAESNAASLSHSPPPPAHSTRSVVSPLPPAALSPSTSVTSLASSSEQQPQPTTGTPSADEYQFDFLLYSQFDFSSFFSSYAANDPLFSWLCTPSHTAVHPFARARLSQKQRSSESRFEFARAGGEEEEGHRDVDSKEDGSSGGSVSGVDAAMSKQADSAWNEQKVDPAAGQGHVVIQQVGDRQRAR